MHADGASTRRPGFVRIRLRCLRVGLAPLRPAFARSISLRCRCRALRRWRARRGSAGCPSSGRLGGLARSRGRSRRSGPWPSLGQLDTRSRATAETLGSRDWWRLRRRTRAMARVEGAAGEEAQGSSWALHPQVRLGKLVQGVPRRDARLGARHEGRPVEQVMRGAPRPLAPRCRMPCS